MQIVCSLPCAQAYAEQQGRTKWKKELAESKKKQKIARAEAKQKKEETKSIRWHLNRAQDAFNAYIKARDFGKPCICCGDPMDWYVNKDIDAGHWRTQAAAGHLRFHEDNVHAQLVYCNRNKAGNQAAMREGMILRIGLERVEALENDNRIKNWTREELAEITRIYRLKLKELKSKQSS